jgi:uncharacterized protein (DUF2345 family)
MFSFFSGGGGEDVSAPFQTFIQGQYFDKVQAPKDLKIGSSTNLKGVVLIRGDAELVVSQNNLVTGRTGELQIHRASASFVERVERSFFVIKPLFQRKQLVT